MNFEGGVVAVTGGASGIGFATASQLASLGASVALIDLNKDLLQQSAKVISDLGQTVMTVSADVTNTDETNSAIAAIVDKFGRLDGFVACAGIRMVSAQTIDLDDEAWDNIIRVNLRGMFVSLRAAARQMASVGSGVIVTIGSLSGHAPRVGQSAYSVSKAGVIQLTRVLALELAEKGIRVNTVCPGVVNTAMMKLSRAQDGEDVVNRKLYGSLPEFRVGIPLRRYAEPEDVADAVVYLLSPGARHITGQSFFVDGGESIV
ncbi:MAG: SDR family oxidoreductase [Actinomycetota bacterium]|nr:MAG: SDR family oxidoreductase [Actinomycetota bacterium]